jgi:L-seryl-tRNA(Ser) seleniumtransferase
MADHGRNLYRQIPSIDRLLKHPKSEALLRRFNRGYVTAKCRVLLDSLRAAMREGLPTAANGLDEASLCEQLEREIAEDSRHTLARVVNATGTILHTNLGRAFLAAEAVEAVAAAAAGPVTLEYDLEEGKRGKRETGVEKLLVELTEAESATAVNNNAAAVLLALNTLAQDREVIVSRGELIEIGGSFRIPEIMARSGAQLREVGTTNRTHPEDYEKAIGEKTALLLKVHTSNYRVVGFHSEVGLAQLVAIGRNRNIPVMEDLGSGALVDLSGYGLPREPIVSESVRLGADIVTFSGDKVLGGPQAGLVVGKKDYIQRMNANPLKRALRCGKLTLAALEATLRLYRQSADLSRAIPTLAALTRPVADLRRTAEELTPRLRQALGDRFDVSLADSTSEIGSGALPGEEIPTVVLVVSHPTMAAEKIAERFRRAQPPILGRIKDDCFLLDLRAVFDADDLIPRFGDAS